MPCPHIRLSNYSTPAVRVYLCHNPIRGDEVSAPSLGHLREYCLTDFRYESCPGYRRVFEKKDEKKTDPSPYRDLLWNL